MEMLYVTVGGEDIYLLTKLFRQLLDSVQTGKLEPEVALLNASLVCSSLLLVKCNFSGYK